MCGVGPIGLFVEGEVVNYNKLDIYGRTPFLVPSGGGHQGVQVIVEAEDINPNRPVKDSRKPLLFAV